MCRKLGSFNWNPFFCDDCVRPESQSDKVTPYNQLDHSHCFDQETPACGIEKKLHSRCCLCEKKAPVEPSPIQEAHETQEGYCCACEYDIIGMNEKINSEKARILEQVRGMTRKCDHEFGCGAVMDYETKTVDSICGSPPWFHDFLRTRNKTLSDVEKIIKELK